VAKNTKIEWTDHSFNPWTGCTKVSPGCDHCYAEGWAKRSGTVRWGADEPRRRTTEANWRQPVKWNQEARAAGKRARVFCSSLADVFDNEVPEDWRHDLFDLIDATPHLDWLLLTKRIGNAKGMIERIVPSMIECDHGAWPWPHVWIGATVVNQEESDRDIPKLLQVPARVRFLSVEPMLGPIDLVPYIHCDVGNAIDWIICGGESGPGARPMHPDWARSLRDQCKGAGVPFLFKQWGEWREPAEGEQFSTAMGRAQKVPAFIVAPEGTVHCFENDLTRDSGKAMIRVGKRAAGRLLDDVQHDELPT
jgi:protein gp37